MFLILVFVGWRSLGLGADPPATFIPNDFGYHIDEGYKTLGPRNLALFESVRWNPEDNYYGWMARSPVTQWSYYLSFRLGSVDHRSPRVVSVLFFAGLLLSVAYFLGRRGPPAVALVAIAILGTDAGLFHFSRVALFEIAISMFVYGGVLAATTLPFRGLLAPLAILLAAGVVTVFGVKVSALLYVAPAIAVHVLLAALARRSQGRSAMIVVWVGLAAGIGLMVATFDVWYGRLDLAALASEPSEILFSPMYMLSPLAISLAYMALLDIVLKDGAKPFLENRYLSSLASIVVLVSLTLPWFGYHPPRYYLPVIPGALLLVVEWLRLTRSGSLAETYRFSWARIGVAALVMLPLVASLLGFWGMYVVPLVPLIPQGLDPGIDRLSLVRIYPLVMVLAGATTVLLFWRGWLRRTVQGAMFLGIGAQIAFSVASSADAVLHPTFHTDEIGRRLTEIVAPGQSIAGDWAPYFALGTATPALFMSRTVNPPERLHQTRPTYFLDSQTVWDDQSVRGIQDAGFELGPPEVLGEFFGREIELHRIQYGDDR